MATTGHTAIQTARRLLLNLRQRHFIINFFPVMYTFISRSIGSFLSGHNHTALAFHQMAGILHQRFIKQVAYISNFQRIGGTGNHTTSAAHAILQRRHTSRLLTLSPYRDAHIAYLFTTLTVITFVCIHVDAVETGMIKQTKCRAVRTKITTVKAITDDGGNKESAEIGQRNNEIKAADKTHRP